MRSLRQRLRRSRGFTLLECMVGLGILGFALVVLMRSTTNNIVTAEQSRMMGVVTDLARGKMYDIEESLLKDGFQATDQHVDDQKFSEEGWPDITYSYKVEQVELPSFQDIQAMAQGRAQAGSAGSPGSGSQGSGSSTGSNGFMDSTLGGAFSMMAGNQDVSSAQGASFLQTIFQQFQEILKVSIRKVTLTVNYQVMSKDQDPIVVVLFLTDSASMDQVLNGLGSQDLPDSGSGSGSGTGSGSGSRTTGTGSGAGSGFRPPVGSGK